MGITTFFGGLFGLHHQTATSTPFHNREDSASSTPWQDGERMMPGVFGTVSAINGTTLTVDGHSASTTATTTYSVDASSAKIFKGSATTTATISNIAVGDKVVVEGTVTGTSVVAKVIIDGAQLRMMNGEAWRDGTSTPRGPERVGTTTQKDRGAMMPRGWMENPKATVPAPHE